MAILRTRLVWSGPFLAAGLLAACGGGGAKTSGGATGGHGGSGGPAGTGGTTSTGGAASTTGTAGTTGVGTGGQTGTGGAACSVSPSSDPWASIGPNAGAVSAFTATSTAIVVATSAGQRLLRSGDGGQTWHPPQTASLTERVIVAGMAATPTEILAAVNDGGIAVMRSTDGGVTWTAASTGLDNTGVEHLLQLDAGVFALTQASIGSNLFRWDPTTLTWQGLGAPMPFGFVAATGADVYGGTGVGTNLYASHAGGAWKLLPAAPNTEFISASGGVLITLDNLVPYRSTDAGMTWKATMATPLGVGFMVPTPSGFLAPFGTIDTSSDLGLTFQAETTGLPTDGGLHLATVAGASFYVGGEGLYRRPAGGPASWTGIPLPVDAISILTGDDSVLLASDGGTPVVSTDQGMTWGITSSIGGMASASITPSGAFVADVNAKLTRSTDNAKTWKTSTVPPAPKLPGNVSPRITGFAASSAALLAGSGNAYIFLNQTNEFAGYGVYRSTDDGATWTDSSGGLPVIGQDAGNLPIYDAVNAVAIGPSASFAGTEAHGIFVSTDGGQSWGAASSGIPADSMGRLPAVEALLVGESAVLAATSGIWTPQASQKGPYQMWRSTNQGTTWTEVTSALPTGVHAARLAGHGDRVFASAGDPIDGVPTDGVYTSGDGGATWAPLLDGLEGTASGPMVVTSSSLFLGTLGRSVFKHGLVCK